MGHIAAGMHIAERTLHRRLAREGTSYRALLDEVRETLAKELLANGLTVKEVSDRLGYSEPAAFTHAYTRWHGAPPRTRLT
jgi:AraC-like DNA-binding protein